MKNHDNMHSNPLRPFWLFLCLCMLAGSTGRPVLWGLHGCSGFSWRRWAEGGFQDRHAPRPGLLPSSYGEAAVHPGFSLWGVRLGIRRGRVTNTNAPAQRTQLASEGADRFQWWSCISFTHCGNRTLSWCWRRQEGFCEGRACKDWPVRVCWLMWHLQTPVTVIPAKLKQPHQKGGRVWFQVFSGNSCIFSNLQWSDQVFCWHWLYVFTYTSGHQSANCRYGEEGIYCLPGSEDISRSILIHSKSAKMHLCFSPHLKYCITFVQILASHSF